MSAYKQNDVPIFVQYDDENLEHVEAGPDYGQPWSSSCWRETDSKEYPDFLEEVCEKILHNRLNIVSD